MRKQLQEFYPTATVHGMRRTWRNWAETFVPESSVRREAKEWCLMHGNRNRVEERYLDETYYEERQTIMFIWGKYLKVDTEPENMFLDYSEFEELVEKERQEEWRWFHS
jgi:hypothetical protein